LVLRLVKRWFINKIFLHQLSNVDELFKVVAREHGSIDESLVEKDYWIMHCLWGIQQQGYSFDLKGGTSLSKGFGIIERFSEDIDIQIHPPVGSVKKGKNHDKSSHIESRRQFFDKTAAELNIPDLIFSRDHAFDDESDMRSGGIRAEYNAFFDVIPELKAGVLLELGFDKTTPNLPCDITSWAFEKAKELNLDIIDNRAKQVACYYPEYTFVEKLQTISTKYRKQQKENTMPINFLRHYYDVYKLLENERILRFVGSNEYYEHKDNRFRSQDEKDISKNLAFTLPDLVVRKLYSDEFKKKPKIYYGKQPEFEEILLRVSELMNRL
jgi:predicted nucleotidyltransferase component of viral defense system